MDCAQSDNDTWPSGVDAAMTAREFLDAASNGDVSAVDAWLASDPCGDVNVVRGEGWTALLYAASRSQVRVVQRLVVHPSIDLNATTVIGTSALEMALKRRNNTMIKLLLSRGASRYTIFVAVVLALVCLFAAHAHMTEALASLWMWADVKRMLRPQWSVVWSPALHARFPADQREKCRLVVFANILALRRTRARRRQPPQLHRPGNQSQMNQNAYAANSIGAFMWTLLDAVGVTERALGDGDDEQGDEAHAPFLEGPSASSGAGGDGRLQTANAANTSILQIQWLYLPQPVVHHILEFAMYLW